MSIFGIDYAWSHPSVSYMKVNGVKFIARYLSNDTAKNLSKSEATAASDAGISCVVVYETTANRAMSGRSGGAADAKQAARLAAACGMPDDRPIYFAVDWDATSAQQATINAYLDGAASEIGRDRIGMYAGYYPIKRAFDAGKITYGWQTYAWSAGKWDPRAQIQQYKNGVTFGGADVDYDRAMQEDYGQWRVGESPMAFSDSDKAWLQANMYNMVWGQDKAPVPSGVTPGDNPTWQPINVARETYTRVLELIKAVNAMGKPEVDQDDVNAIVSGVLAGMGPVMNPEALAESIATHLGPDMAQQTLDALRSRLET